MKSLTNYINENLLIENLLNTEISSINEGIVWKKIFGGIAKALNKGGSLFQKWSDEEKGYFYGAQEGAVKLKDKELKTAATDTLKAAQSGDPKKYLEKLKLEVQLALKRMNVDGNTVDYCLPKQRELAHLAKESNDSEGTELAEKFKKAIDKKWPDFSGDAADQKLKEIDATVKKSGALDEKGEDEGEGKSEEQPVSKEKSDLGIGDGGEQQATSTKQETNAVTDEIKASTDFFKPLANEAGLNGETLRDSIVSMINKSLKHEDGKDKNGNPIYKWNKDTKGFQSKNEEKLIKGLGAIISGLVMINHKGMNEAITGKLVDFGFSAKDYINNLK